MAERSNLQQRTITGIIGASLMISFIFLSQITFMVLITLISLASLHELFHLFKTKTALRPNSFMAMFIAFFSILITYLIQIQLLPNACFFLIIPLVSVLFVAELYRKNVNPFSNISITLLGLIYTVLPFIFFLKISFLYQNQYLWKIVMGIFLILWTSDVGAYIAGKSFGKNKLFPSVSPGKTWEGTIGGAFLSIVVSVIIANFWIELPIIQWLGISIIIIIFGMFGDLVESGLKRSIGVKDSGTMIPGHGGFLDRFDGLYLSLPVIYSYLQFFY